MNYSSGLEYIIEGSYFSNSYSKISYFSKNVDDNYIFDRGNTIAPEPQYSKKILTIQYKTQQEHHAHYSITHYFTPEIFLKPSRPKARFIVHNSEAISIAEEVFELI